MSASHTPGPWSFSEFSPTWLKGADGSTVYHVDPFGNHIPSEPDARLIAAAPDLLAVLKEAAATLERCRYSEQDMAKKCLAAIAKAEDHS